MKYCVRSRARTTILPSVRYIHRGAGRRLRKGIVFRLKPINEQGRSAQRVVARLDLLRGLKANETVPTHRSENRQTSPFIHPVVPRIYIVSAILFDIGYSFPSADTRQGLYQNAHKFRTGCAPLFSLRREINLTFDEANLKDACFHRLEIISIVFFFFCMCAQHTQVKKNDS